MGDPRNLEPASFGGSSLEQMHSWVHSGSGADVMHSTSDLWAQEQKYMRDLADRVRDRMTQAKVVIESQSGDAMQNAVAPVVLWSDVTADNALTQSQRMQEQGEAFSKVQAAVPNPSEMKPVPSDNFLQKAWASVTDSKTDTQLAQQHNEQLRQEAVTAFNSYQSTSQSSVSGTPVFTAPPAAAVDTSVQSGGGPGVGSFGSPSGGGSAGGSAGGGFVGSHGGGGGLAGGTPGTAPNLSGSHAASPTATHAAGVGSMPNVPSLQPSALGAGGAGGAGGGLNGGFSGVLGGFGGGAAGGGIGGSGGRLGGTGSGGLADEEQSGRAGAGRGGSAGRAGSLAAKEGTAAGRGSNSTSQGGVAGRGAGKKGEEDDEHYSPEFLKGDHGFFDENIPRVAPPVFGE